MLEVRRRLAWATRRLLIPTFVLVGLASIPVLNPLLPSRMETLEDAERELKAVASPGNRLDAIRNYLGERNIRYEQEVIPAPWTGKGIPPRRVLGVSGETGDVLLIGRVDVNARKFPCRYDLQFMFLFGKDNLLKHRNVDRRVVCI